MTAALVLQAALLLHSHLLKMHMANATAPGNLPLIIYATGDAGWKRGDRHTFDMLKSWGYPVAGFASPDYLKHLGHGVKTIAPPELARDYAAMIDFAEQQMARSSSSPVILLGVSRGAGLSVAAAAQEALRDRLAGVVAIGLTGEEEYLGMDDLYGHLPSLGTLPVAVVQSTGDNYVPAARARELFGADTMHRLLRAITAKNHNFSDARAAMYDAIRSSLAWIDDQR